MSDFLVFAGTSEGRRLVETLAAGGASVCACVATAYGKTLLPESVKVFAERLDEEEMITMLQTLRFDCVIDATHPYAALATENIKAACAVCETRYLRLMRPESRAAGCVYAESAERAAELLAATTGRVLLTTGSKELDFFTRVPDYQNRLYPRVLPTIESIQRCLALGYRVQNIVAMQGPFTRELNGATMRQLDARILVTKESGDAGGFSEKLGAAQDVGATAIVIGRPCVESGYGYDELLELLSDEYQLTFTRQKSEALYFPVFANLSKRKITIFGGGMVAARRAAALIPFCERIVAIAPSFTPEMQSLDIALICRPYLRGDCEGSSIVLAATDNREVNHAIYEEARMEKIIINVADAPDECDFYFPAVVQSGAVVVGVTASGTAHRLAKDVARDIRALLGDSLPGGGGADGRA